MTTNLGFGLDGTRQHHGLSSIFADMVRDALPEWAGDIPVETLVISTPALTKRGERGPTDIISVSVTQISTPQVLSIGLPDALSSVEWEVRMLFNNFDPSAFEQIQQYLTMNLYNRWYKSPLSETVIRGSILRDNRLDTRVDAGYRWAGRLRFRSEVYGAFLAGFVPGLGDDIIPLTSPATL